MHQSLVTLTDCHLSAHQTLLRWYSSATYAIHFQIVLPLCQPCDVPAFWVVLVLVIGPSPTAYFVPLRWLFQLFWLVAPFHTVMM